MRRGSAPADEPYSRMEVRYVRRAIALVLCAGVILSLVLACGCKSGGSSGGGNTPEKAKEMMLKATGGKGLTPPKAGTTE